MSEHSERSARASLESIVEMVEDLQNAMDFNDDDKYEETLTYIYEDPLDIAVRKSGWVSLGFGYEDNDFDEFMILVTTGGPAVRVIGDLDQCGEPVNARIQHQDWFEPWTDLEIDTYEEECLLTYCQQFYFME